MPKKKSTWKKKKPTMNESQRRNSDIFRLRGFYANACTLPFGPSDLKAILQCVDNALHNLGAEEQSSYMKPKKMPF